MMRGRIVGAFARQLKKMRFEEERLDVRLDL
jgi:hypothetical protein